MAVGRQDVVEYLYCNKSVPHESIVHRPRLPLRWPSRWRAGMVHRPRLPLRWPSRRRAGMVYRPSSMVYGPSSIVHGLSSIVHGLWSIVHRPSSMVYGPSSIVHHLWSIPHHSHHPPHIMITRLPVVAFFVETVFRVSIQTIVIPASVFFIYQIFIGILP